MHWPLLMLLICTKKQCVPRMTPSSTLSLPIQPPLTPLCSQISWVSQTNTWHLDNSTRASFPTRHSLNISICFCIFLRFSVQCVSASFLHLFADNAALCLLLSISLASPPLVLMQLQDLLTPMTSSERCSISRGCEHDQVGTSLSSFGYKGRVACVSTSSPNRKAPAFVCCQWMQSIHLHALFNLSSFLKSGLRLLSFSRSQILCSSSISSDCTHVRIVKGM